MYHFFSFMDHATGVLSKKLLPKHLDIFLRFLQKVLQFHVSYLCLEFILVNICGSCKVYIFSCLIFPVPCQEGDLFYIELRLLPWWKSGDCICVGLCLVLYFVLLKCLFFHQYYAVFITIHYDESDIMSLQTLSFFKLL